jgi:hypothetical protein
MSHDKLSITQGFSGEPLARWDGPRNMVLVEDFYYIDPNGKKWIAPCGSRINGATIPKFLWDELGGPYSGPYRRASVVHDVAVGELDNPDVPYSQRKAADRMFYHACRFDGCSLRFAGILYMGVRTGSYWSGLTGWVRKFITSDDEIMRDDPEAEACKKKFWAMVDKATSMSRNEKFLALTTDMEEQMLDELDALMDDELKVK